MHQDKGGKQTLQGADAATRCSLAERTMLSADRQFGRLVHSCGGRCCHHKPLSGECLLQLKQQDES